MNKIFNSLQILIFFVFFFIIVPQTNQIFANEGQFFMKSSLNNEAECLSSSVEVTTNKFTVLVTCRGLVYPPLPPSLDSYFLWADGADRKSPVFLTDLKFGKGQATVTGSFDRLFVTLERGAPKQPTGPTIMSANIKPYEFDRIETEINSNTQYVTPTPPVPTPKSPDNNRSFWQSNFGRLIVIITAGFLIFIFIIIVYGKRK